MKTTYTEQELRAALDNAEQALKRNIELQTRFLFGERLFSQEFIVSGVDHWRSNCLYWQAQIDQLINNQSPK